MMTDKLISFETAKLAKEKGFNEYTFNYHCISEDYIDDDNDCYPVEVDYDFGLNNWNSSDNNFSISDLKLDWDMTDVFAVPTQSLLQKWLREKHNEHIRVTYMVEDRTYSSSLTLRSMGWSSFKTYEEALEKGLQEALKLI